MFELDMKKISKFICRTIDIRISDFYKNQTQKLESLFLVFDLFSLLHVFIRVHIIRSSMSWISGRFSASISLVIKVDKVIIIVI